MPDLSQIRNFNLKVIFLTHFVFISLSSMGFWNSSAYLFYNSVFILLLVWSLYNEQSHEPIQLAIVVNCSSIILDILLLVMGFPDNNAAREKFSAAMAILHLIIRPFSTILLVKNLEERSGVAGHNPTSYEDIDRSNPSQSFRPSNLITPQQI